MLNVYYRHIKYLILIILNNVFINVIKYLMLMCLVIILIVGTIEDIINYLYNYCNYDN